MAAIKVLLTKTAIAEFANAEDPDETVHNERLIRIYSDCPLVFKLSANTV